ncbi:hypothetical protein SCLCIDRAFT_1179219, partial [Scleroderma citrinum Foug A]
HVCTSKILARPPRCVRKFSSSTCFLRRHNITDGDLLSAELPEFSDNNDHLVYTVTPRGNCRRFDIRAIACNKAPLWQNFAYCQNMHFSHWLEEFVPGFRDPQPRHWLGGEVVNGAFLCVLSM